MEVGKFRVPLRMNFDPLSGPVKPFSPERSLSRQLMSSMNRLNFQQEQAGFSASARGAIAQGARDSLFQNLSQRLGALSASLPSLAQSVNRLAEAGVADAGRASVLTSGHRLDLGTATTVTPGGPPAPPKTFDPAGKLADQPLATAVTAGQLDFRVAINGSSGNYSLAIDPTQQSLNDVLGQISAVSGISASYDAASGQVRFDVNNAGATFEVTQTGGTSNFLQVALQDQQQRVTTAAGGDPVDATKGQTVYNDLRITYQGKQFNLTGLAVSNSNKSADAQTRATELAGQINTQLAAQGTSLRASAANGTLSFTATENGNQPTLAAGISFDELAPAAGGGKGKGKKGGGGGGATALSLGLEDPATTSRVQITGKPRIDASAVTPPAAGPKLGPGAQLKDLAGQLGLQSQNGAYTFSINGQQLSFREDQTLNDVIAGINRSSAGVNAAYDATGGRVVLTAREAGATAIVAQDTQGNLMASLGLQVDRANFSAGAPSTPATTAVTESALAAEGVDGLKRLGEQLGEVISLLNAATGDRSAFRDDPLLRDLGDAVSGLFGGGGGQGIQSLGDLGLSLQDGRVRFDASRLEGLSAAQVDEANAFLSTFATQQLQPLVKNGQQALADAQALAPGNQRAAEQAVAVRAEISRMQNRQQLLLHHQVTLEKQSESIKRQDEELDGLRKRLDGTAEEQEFPPPPPGVEARRALTTGSVPADAGGPPLPPSIGSFGLSS